MRLGESILDRAFAGSERLLCAAGISRRAGLGGAMLVAGARYIIWVVPAAHVLLEKLAAQEIRRRSRLWDTHSTDRQGHLPLEIQHRGLGSAR